MKVMTAVDRYVNIKEYAVQDYSIYSKVSTITFNINKSEFRFWHPFIQRYEDKVTSRYTIKWG